MDFDSPNGEPNSKNAITIATEREVALRAQRIARFVQVAAGSNINISNTDFNNIRDVRESVVFKEGRVRDMVDGGNWQSSGDTENIWSLRSDTNMNSDQQQNDRSIIVRGVGLMINPECDIANLETILQYGQVRVHSPNSDYLDWTPPLEDLIIAPVRQVSETNNATATASGTGINGYEFVRSRGQGKFNLLPQPLLVEKNSKATLTIETITGKPITNDLTLQMVLVCDLPII